MKTKPLDKKSEEQNKESIFKNYELTLSEKEAEDLVKRLENGPNEKARVFLKESIEFYKNIKNRVLN